MPVGRQPNGSTATRGRAGKAAMTSSKSHNRASVPGRQRSCPAGGLSQDFAPRQNPGAPSAQPPRCVGGGPARVGDGFGPRPRSCRYRARPREEPAHRARKSRRRPPDEAPTPGPARAKPRPPSTHSAMSPRRTPCAADSHARTVRTVTTRYGGSRVPRCVSLRRRARARWSRPANDWRPAGPRSDAPRDRTRFGSRRNAGSACGTSGARSHRGVLPDANLDLASAR
ncbi:hypothetical protein FB470_005545 [Amycolatopsis thermophila]|uniref:Uncharacterized protein n=1 Tax=Amycolatopsis thermophila TaxID=206084 RepID=A0ABU0F207_9PSEU|nr:hypothetical protein [Amycolatopsis thermophila]